MENTIIIELAGKITSKGRPRFSRKSGAVYTPKKTVNIERELALLARSAMANRDKIDGPVAVEVIAHFAIPKSVSKTAREKMLGSYVTKKPDADNIAKLVDAFNAIIFNDDAQISVLSVKKIYSDTERLVFRITNLSKT
jgi:Holliday junction resolvase RusA-like endonuclease